MKKVTSIRWILLGAGIAAILGLTAMNVFSLYKLHETTIESDLENKKLQVSEFTDKVHHRFFAPFWGLGSMDIEHIENFYNTNGHFPKALNDLLKKAAEDSIYNSIYFKPHSSSSCQSQGSIQKYDTESGKFIWVSEFPEPVCDGMGIARTRMKVLIDEYRYNNKVIFDTHNSITIALINLSSQKVFGYLTMPINQEYLVNNYLQPKLIEKFGNADQSGVVVWLRDWTRDETIASSSPWADFDQDKVQYYQRFPDFFDNWTLKVAFVESPTVAASKASLIKNLVVLGAAFFLLLGALVFMFITAQRERALAQRQAGFLANVTHELKTPLAVMQAAGENLADGRVKSKSRLKSYGTHIYNEAVRLKSMIEKLLDVAKADARQNMISPQPVKADKLLKEYLENHRSYIKNQGFTLDVHIENNLSPVKLDPDSFETILANLVENALKYSREDKFIKIELVEREGKLRLTIEDHGVGIPKKSLKHIFEKFYRVEDTLTAKSKGHGLGLSIVKNLVELNDGKIYVESVEQNGSKFIVEFPVLTDEELLKRMEKKESISTTFSQLKESPEYAG